MLKHLYKTAFFLAVGFLSLQNSNAQQCPSADLTVTGDTTCVGTNPFLTISNAEINTSYQAFENNMAVSQTVLGSGGNLTFSTSPLASGNHVISIKASRAGCPDQTLLDTALIKVNQAPRIDQVVIGDTICDNAAFATIRIYGTTPGETYQAFLNNVAVAGVAIAKSDTIFITIPRILLSLGISNFSIRASISGCATSVLTQQAIVLVNPIPMAANLMVKGDTICSTSPFAKITITPSSKSSQYELSNGLGALMNPFYGDSTKNFTVKNIPTSLLAIGENIIQVSTTFNMGVCGTTNLTATASIVIHPAPEAPKLKLTGDTVLITDKFATIKIKNTEKHMPYSFSRVSKPDTTIFAISDSIELKIPIGPPSGLLVGTHKIFIHSSIQGCTVVTSLDSAIVVVKPDPTLSTENYFINSNFSVYPNPFSSELHVSSKLNENMKIQIVDALGNVVHQQTTSANEEIKINPDLKSGLYFLQMECEGKRELVKLIKQ